MPIAIGGVEVKYSFKFFDQLGTTELFECGDWLDVDGSRVEAGVGVVRLVIPGHYPEDQIAKWMGMVTWERSLGNEPMRLMWEQCYFRVDWELVGLEKGAVWEILLVDANILTAAITVDYPAGSSQSEKLGAGDNILKAVMRENRGTLATDTTRDISAYLDVQADAGAGGAGLAPTTRKTFSNRNALSMFREICAEALESGTYLTFDTICKVQPGGGVTPKFEFRTYTGQRGADHRSPNGAQGAVLIGPDFGSFEPEWRYGYKTYQRVASRVIVGGRGEKSQRPYKRADNTALQGLGPLGLWEYFVDSQNSTDDDDTALQDEANNIIKLMRPRRTFTGTLSKNNKLLPFVNYGHGDYLTVRVQGQSFDAHLPGMQVKKGAKGEEQVIAILRSEE